MPNTNMPRHETLRKRGKKKERERGGERERVGERERERVIEGQVVCGTR